MIHILSRKDQREYANQMCNDQKTVYLKCQTSVTFELLFWGGLTFQGLVSGNMLYQANLQPTLSNIIYSTFDNLKNN